jgi:hypothetical protein
MLTVVTFKWRPPPGYRSTFAGEHVDVLRRMVARHYPEPHRFVCVTDDARGIQEPDVELFELWPDFATVANPSGRKNPSCYRRLRLFARHPGAWLGERFVVLDLDAVIVGDMRPLWNRPEDFVIWKSSTSGNPYNGSMWMLRAGARPQVWRDFDPAVSPRETKAAGFYGSDQAWIAHALGPDEATWSARDGVHSYRNEIQHGAGRLPAGARVVFFHGKTDPWDADAQRHAWVREAYR